MKIRKYRKAKKNNFPVILLGLLLILGAFAYTIRQLSEPVSGEVSPPALTETEIRQNFINELAPHAKELQAGYGILPSIILGQACLESNFGQSQLASEYKNLFGIKAYGDVPKVTLSTQEFVNEQWVTIDGDFRVYDNWGASMDDHTQLFINGVDWNPQLYAGVLTAANYQEAAVALQSAGYATDPTYADKIISVIEQYQLNQYDQ